MSPSETVRESSGKGSEKQRTVAVGLVLVALGAAVELVDEVLLQGAFQPRVDPFPLSISNWDAQVFLAINGGLANLYLGWFFNIVTRLGSTLFMFVLSVLLYMGGRRREGMLMLASIMFGTLIVLPLKLAVPRPRPYVSIPSAIVFGREAGSSFPSGHTVRIFAFALVASKLRPRLSLPFYSLACLVAFSRIYTGQHYPLDILAGIVIGLLAGYLTVRYEDGILKAASELRLPVHSRAPEPLSARPNESSIA